MQSAYASDIDDILKNLESPEVDYHVDSEIKTIVVPQPEFYPAIKPDLRTKFKNPNTPKQATVKKTNNQQKENAPKQINKTAQNTGNKTDVKADAKTDKNKTEKQTKSLDSKDNNNKESLKSVSKSEIKKEAAKPADKKQKSKVADKNSKPIKVYSLFLFFKDMKVIQTWAKGIPENLEFFRSLFDTTLVFWKQKIEEENEDEVLEGDEDEDEEEEEEEEKKVDFSKFDSIIAKGEELYNNRDWDELQKLVEENPDASEAPAMQKFKMMLELNKKKPNLNQVRNFAEDIIKDNPNSPEGNYGLAYFYYYNTKKPNPTEASKYIKIAVQGKNPLKEAVKLSNEISKSKLIKIVIIVLISVLVLSIVVFIIFKKLKARKKNKPEADKTNQENIQQSAQTESQSSANTVVQTDNQIIQQPTAETTDINNPVNNEVVEEIIEEVVEEPQSGNAITEYSTDETIGNASNTGNDNQVIVEEVIEEVEEPVEEIIEEVEETEGPEEEVVEEVIEEIEEEEPEEEVIEEIIEEVEEDDDDYSDDIDSISEEALLTE